MKKAYPYPFRSFVTAHVTFIQNFWSRFLQFQPSISRQREQESKLPLESPFQELSFQCRLFFDLEPPSVAMAT